MDEQQVSSNLANEFKEKEFRPKKTSYWSYLRESHLEPLKNTQSESQGENPLRQGCEVFTCEETHNARREMLAVQKEARIMWITWIAP